MAAHNGRAFIGAQLESILGQLRAGDEVVVVDDASFDDTPDLVESLHDPRVRLIRLTENVGYVRAFERALIEAKGDHILLSDQDDVWPPGRIEAMRAELDQAAVVAGNLTTLDGPDAIRGPYGQPAWRLRPADSRRRWGNTIGILAGNRPYFGSAMGLNRDALAVVLPFPAYLDESHDLWIALCGIHLGSIEHLAQAVTTRRLHDSNATPVRPRALPLVLRSRLLMLRLTADAMARARRAAGSVRRH
jgi:glycosyltransferase involved in cell wall biosynthesis